MDAPDANERPGMIIIDLVDIEAGTCFTHTIDTKLGKWGAET